MLRDIVPNTAKTGNLREALAAQMEIGRTRRRTQALTSVLQRLPVERRDDLDRKLLGGVNFLSANQNNWKKWLSHAGRIVLGMATFGLVLQLYVSAVLGQTWTLPSLVNGTVWVLLFVAGFMALVYFEDIKVDELEGLAILSAYRVFRTPAWLIALAPLARVLTLLATLLLGGPSRSRNGLDRTSRSGPCGYPPRVAPL